MSNWCSILGLCSALSAAPVPTTIAGAVYVHDGDTLYVNHQAVRLFGVDAEELSEPTGIRAREALRDIVSGKSVTCVPEGASHHRSVSRCYIGDVEINNAIVKSGWALDCAKYSGGAYRKSEPPGARLRLIQKPYC